MLPTAEIAIVGPASAPEPGYTGWVVINYDILAKHPLRSTPGVASSLDEAHYLKTTAASGTACRWTWSRPSATRRDPPFDRHAVDEPPARSLPLVATGSSRARAFVRLIRQALLRRVQGRVRLGRRRGLQYRRTDRAVAWHHAAPHQGRGPRPAAQDSQLARRGGRQPSGSRYERGRDGAVADHLAPRPSPTYRRDRDRAPLAPGLDHGPANHRAQPLGHRQGPQHNPLRRKRIGTGREGPGLLVFSRTRQHTPQALRPKGRSHHRRGAR